MNGSPRGCLPYKYREQEKCLCNRLLATRSSITPGKRALPIVLRNNDCFLSGTPPDLSCPIKLKEFCNLYFQDAWFNSTVSQVVSKVFLNYSRNVSDSLTILLQPQFLRFSFTTVANVYMTHVWSEIGSFHDNVLLVIISSVADRQHIVIGDFKHSCI